MGKISSQMMLRPFYILFSEPSPAEFPRLGVFLLFFYQEKLVFLHCVNFSFDSLFPSLWGQLFYWHKTHICIFHYYIKFICLHCMAIRTIMFLPVEAACYSMVVVLIAWKRANVRYISWKLYATAGIYAPRYPQAIISTQGLWPVPTYWHLYAR